MRIKAQATPGRADGALTHLYMKRPAFSAGRIALRKLVALERNVVVELVGQLAGAGRGGATLAAATLHR